MAYDTTINTNVTTNISHVKMISHLCNSKQSSMICSDRSAPFVGSCALMTETEAACETLSYNQNKMVDNVQQYAS
jgi:hypothetical protein